MILVIIYVKILISKMMIKLLLIMIKIYKQIMIKIYKQIMIKIYKIKVIKLIKMTVITIMMKQIYIIVNYLTFNLQQSKMNNFKMIDNNKHNH